MNHARTTSGIRWDRLWRLAAPGAAKALWIALRVGAIASVALVGLALLVPYVPVSFWRLGAIAASRTAMMGRRRRARRRTPR